MKIMRLALTLSSIPKFRLTLLAVTIAYSSGVVATDVSSSPDGPQSLEALYLESKQSRSAQSKKDKAREATFIAARQNQKAMLDDSEKKLKATEARSDELKKLFEANEETLTQLNTLLQQKTGAFGELFGVVRQSAVDLKAVMNNSLITAEFPKRTGALAGMSTAKALPTISELENLWFAFQREMIETGRVTQFSADVVLPDGTAKKQLVTRVGSFTAVSEGSFLRYLPDSKQLMILPRQPTNPHRSVAQRLSQTSADQTSSQTLAATIDPTSGSILGLIVETPRPMERINQGGVIGYIILFIGLVGLVIAAFRLIKLFSVSSKIKIQLNNIDRPSDDNPLGRVLKICKQYQNEPLETLELRLDEAILKETPRLSQGVRILKLLAAIAPLLGLLGTVTGMIATFQAITLFGTGDPKLMADGISQALVTTMLGLIVAVPLLFLHAALAARSQRFIQILDEQSAGILARQMDVNVSGSESRADVVV